VTSGDFRAAIDGYVDPEADLSAYVSFTIEIGRDPDNPERLFSKVRSSPAAPCRGAVAAVLCGIADKLEQLHEAEGCE
jgi:hypothetical protein